MPISKQKHTPGPWVVRYRAGGDPEREFFVEAPRLDPSHGYNIEILCEDGNYPDEMRRADAHLIAAAPNYDRIARDISAEIDLALAGGSADTFMTLVERLRRWRGALRAAIAKAEVR